MWGKLLRYSTCISFLLLIQLITGRCSGGSVAEWLACWTQAQKVAALLRVVGVTAGLAESNGSLPLSLWLTSPAGWLPRTGISSVTLRSVIEYGLPLLTIALFCIGYSVITKKGGSIKTATFFFCFFLRPSCFLVTGPVDFILDPTSSAVQTVLGVYWRLFTCVMLLHPGSFSVVDDNALYKYTHSLTLGDCVHVGLTSL